MAEPRNDVTAGPPVGAVLAAVGLASISVRARQLGPEFGALPTLERTQEYGPTGTAQSG